jgi:hypothetical protein
MAEIVEEFAPESHTNEFKKVSTLTNKRYATRSVSNSIVENLKKENLLQIQEALADSDSDSDDESRIRYLKLNIANKELELIELKEKYEKAEKIINVLNEFNKVFDIIDNNLNYYTILNDELTSTNYREIMKKEIENIKSHSLPDEYQLIPKHIRNSSLYMYNLREDHERNLAKKFHDKIFYNNKMDSLYSKIQFYLCIILIIHTIVFYFRIF